MSELSKQALQVENNVAFPNNSTGYITPTLLRGFNSDIIDSTVNQAEYTINSGSWNSSISQLNTFTASQQPTFNALNSFTSSQLTINSGVNLFTQSANGRLNALENDTANLETFTSSINQIIVNGESIGTSTRLWFNGYASASIVPNRDGAIASITILADQSFTPSASFNAYTASTNAWSASAKVSINNINSTTASLNTSVSNLNAFSSSTIVSLNALNDFTASDNTSQLALNAFTASQLDINSGYNSTTASLNTSVSNLNLYTASQEALNDTFATTGSNTFNGNQIINGIVTAQRLNLTGGTGIDLVVTGSARITNNLVVAPNGDDAAAYVSNLAVSMYNQTTVDEIGFTLDGATYGTTGWDGPNIYGNSPADDYPALIGFQNKSDWTDGSISVLKPLSITGSLTITGSTYQNVFSASIVNSTASIDFSKANFFTLFIPASTTTHINVQNFIGGQSAMLQIATEGAAATASFSPNVYQPNTSYYVPTNAAGVDILTFSTFDQNKAYLVSVKNMTNN